MENQIQKSQIPEIWETDEEKRLRIGQLKNKYVDFAFKHFVHNPPVMVTNKETGWIIELSDAMIRGAKFLKTVGDSKNTPGIDDVSYFENLCGINGKPFKMNITVKRQTKRCFAYYYSAISVEST
ncbi:MAG: hypothetical protein LBT39_02945 [Treponema sp.]|nr:hypothetical protein [Treponema sp.]